MDADEDARPVEITGIDFEVPETAIVDYLKDLADIPSSVDGVTRNVLSMEAFERAFGIYNHSHGTDPRRPSSISMQTEAYRWFEGDSLEAEIVNLLKMEAPKITNMSLSDLLDLDPYVYRAVKRSMLTYAKDRTDALERMQNEMDGLQGKK